MKSNWTDDIVNFSMFSWQELGLGTSWQTRLGVNWQELRPFVLQYTDQKLKPVQFQAAPKKTANCLGDNRLFYYWLLNIDKNWKLPIYPAVFMLKHQL